MVVITGKIGTRRLGKGGAGNPYWYTLAGCAVVGDNLCTAARNKQVVGGDFGRTAVCRCRRRHI